MSPFECSVGYKPPLFPTQEPDAAVPSALAFVQHYRSTGRESGGFPHYPQWRGCQGVRRNSPGGESGRGAPVPTKRSHLRFPSKACKLTAALAAKAYSAAGQAASALHAMAILQVHQAKALKQVHGGSTDLGLIYGDALRATKVTAWSLGKAMSTMVFQERHLRLNLAEMLDVTLLHPPELLHPRLNRHLGRHVEPLAGERATRRCWSLLFPRRW